MKHILIASLFLVAGLAGCTDTDSTPAPEPTPQNPGTDPLPSNVKGFEHVGRLVDADGTAWPSSSGIWLYGDLAYGSALGHGFYIADVSDPANPTILWNSTDDSESSFSRDADIVAHPDGRITLVLATQSDGMHLYDVTDPTGPVFAARLLTDVPNHNVAAIPGTQLVINSQSGGLGRTNEVVDVSNPFEPAVVAELSDYGCHDVAFFGAPGEAKFRAYCAGIQRTEIWDLAGTEDTTFAATLVSTIEGTDSPVVGNPAFGTYPLRTLHHLAMVNNDASILIIGDEHNGGGSPGTCLAHEETTDLSTPFGALWFYDLSDETAPELLSWFSPPTVEPTPEAGTNSVPNCTAHFGSIVPGEEKLVMAWYSAGVVLVDFTDPTRPALLDQFQEPGINTWDARIHGAHVFTGDITRGMDVLKLV